jgi:N-acetylglutamate synthase-like GNAT family acetyltransferase
MFLESIPEGYEVCVLDGGIVGAYGLSGKNQQFYDLNWILISPDNQGMGIGHKFMSRAIHRAEGLNVAQIKIATSHLATAFFAKYGAVEVCYIPDGWGLGMYRVDMELNLLK